MRLLLNILGLLRSLLLTIPVIFVWTVVMGLLSWMVAPFDPENHKQHACSRIWSRGILWACGVRVRVRGLEQVDFSRSYLFIANHQSYMDIPVLFAHLPVTFRMLAKQSLFKIPFLGWHLARTGHVPIGRQSVHADARALLQAVRQLRQGASFLVFPEGGRTIDGRLQEFRIGIFLAAIKSGAPIVPLTVRGTAHALAHHSWHIRPGKVEIIVDAPVATQGLTKADLDALVARIRSQMESRLNP